MAVVIYNSFSDELLITNNGTGSEQVRVTSVVNNKTIVLTEQTIPANTTISVTNFKISNWYAVERFDTGVTNLWVTVDTFMYAGEILRCFIKKAFDYVCDSCEDCGCKDCENCEDDKCNSELQILNQALFLDQNEHIGNGGISYAPFIKHSYVFEVIKLYTPNRFSFTCEQEIKTSLLGKNCCFNNRTYVIWIMAYYTYFYFTRLEKIKIAYPLSGITPEDYAKRQKEISDLNILFRYDEFRNCLENQNIYIDYLENIYLNAQ